MCWAAWVKSKASLRDLQPWGLQEKCPQKLRSSGRSIRRRGRTPRDGKKSSCGSQDCRDRAEAEILHSSNGVSRKIQISHRRYGRDQEVTRKRRQGCRE